MHSEAMDRGLTKLASMRGEEVAEGFRAVTDSGEFGADLAALAVEFAFAGVWDRPGLDDRSRSLVTIGVLATLGRGSELRNHIEIGMKHGLTPQELEEVLLQIAVYAGLPSAWAALQHAKDVTSGS